MQKVNIILESLGLKYETKFLDLAKGEQKAPEFTKYNPNGRMSYFDSLGRILSFAQSIDSRYTDNN